MASYAEIANDLEARARLLDRTHMQDHGRSMQRAAHAIRELLELKGQLEAAAEEAHQRWEREAIG